MVRMSQLDVQEVIEAVFHTEVAASALRDAFACGDFSFRDYRARVLDHRIGRFVKNFLKILTIC